MLINKTFDTMLSYQRKHLLSKYYHFLGYLFLTTFRHQNHIFRQHGTQHNKNQHYYTEQNETQHNDIQFLSQLSLCRALQMLSVAKCCYATCYGAQILCIHFIYVQFHFYFYLFYEQISEIMIEGNLKKHSLNFISVNFIN